MNTPDELLDLRADGPIAVLTFSGGDSSKLTKKFLAELSTLLTGAPKKPLAHITAHSLLAVFRTVPGTHISLHEPSREGWPLFKGTYRRLADVKDSSRNDLKFAIATDTVEIPDGGQWAGGRTPENTTRTQLQVFDSRAVSRVLADVADRWVAAGDIVDMETWQEKLTAEQQKKNRMPTDDEVAAGYAQRGPISDLDLMDPVRFIPGMLQKIRDYRKAHGLDSGQIKDPRVNRARP